MRKVQKEIVNLKKMLIEQESNAKKDKKVLQLQNAFVWFRDEALQLSKMCKQKQDQYKELMNSSSILRDEKRYLEIALLNSKRENKFL